MGRILLITVLLITALMSIGSVITATERYVIDNERGGIFMGPWDSDWSGLGIYVGIPEKSRVGGIFARMAPEAIKVAHGRFQIFGLHDENEDAFFPYTFLKGYEANELTKGNAPILITATYAGKSRPVYFNWHLGLKDNKATNLERDWSQAVNVGDDRFIDFWIKHYVRKTLFAPGYANTWVGLDNVTFLLSLYGVLDDDKSFVSDCTWDEPFPQTKEEYYDSIKYFFRRTKELAPDIRVVCNLASNEWDRFSELFADVDGLMCEGITGSGAGAGTEDPTTPFIRIKLHNVWEAMMWASSENKLGLLRARIPDKEALQSAYIAYLILRGPNSFFAPAYFGVSQEAPPSHYADIRNALGLPTGLAEWKQEAGSGCYLYWRRTEGGIVYYNRSDRDMEITLPNDREYYDKDGNLVTKLVIPSNAGDYALYEPGTRVAWPEISPAGGTWSREVQVTLKSPTPGTIIRYTLDGSEPTENSTIYRGPFTLTSSATVKAKAFYNPGILDRIRGISQKESFVTSATFNIVNEAPKVEFYLASGSGSDFFLEDFPLISLSVPTKEVVKVDYRVTKGPGSGSGTITIEPGEIYKHFKFDILVDQADQNDGVVEVTLSNPINATLGSKTMYIYKIEKGI